MSQEDDIQDVNLERRFFLKSAATTALISGAAGCATLSCPPNSAQNSFRYQLIRRADRLFVDIEAVGFCEIKRGRRTYLRVADEVGVGTLVFTFPPQHFTESAIPIERAIPTLITLDTLRKIELVPGMDSRLVFHVSKELESIELTAESLLEWSKFELQLPDLAALDSRRYFLGFDWFGDSALKYKSVVEMPWGLYLQPIGQNGVDFRWTAKPQPITHHGQTELWFSSVEHPNGPQYTVPFRVLDTRGLTSADSDPSDGITYNDSPEYAAVRGVVECSPTTNWDRLELAASLSGRFPYTGIPKQNIDTQTLAYQGVRTGSCYVDGRSVDIRTFGISSLGGWLDLESEWSPKPGCALKAWTHRASFGRDHYVKYERAGFLYPFGIPAELVILSEREFIRDDDGHYVAPLIKQAFIQVPQPNVLPVRHGESPFTELSITTVRTPPLDIPVYIDPATNQEMPGNLVDYAMCDYFLPRVAGQPFEFEHRGYDHAGKPAFSRMPMYFVSNKATNAKGLIPEPGLPSNPRPAPLPPMQPIPGSTCTVGHAANMLKDCFNFDAASGLRKLDVQWQNQPFRFAHYQHASIALAPAVKEGDTTNDVDWIEWARAAVPELDEEIGVASRPFLPRARMLKVALPSMRQFSGQSSFMLGTYRDVRNDGNCHMDPDPTLAPQQYLSNVLNVSLPDNALGAYLHILPIKPVRTDAPALYPLDPIIHSDQDLVRNIYFGNSPAAGPHPVPAELFGNLRHEMQFAFDASNESLGGIATPDSPVGLLTRVKGPLGDAVADPRRWAEASPNDPFTILASRVDFIHYRLANRSDALLQPFDLPSAGHGFPSCETFVNLFPALTNPVLASLAMPNPAQTVGNSGLADITSLFGVEAEILPGIRLSRVLKLIGLGLLDAEHDNESQTGPTWSYRVQGLDAILALFGDGPDQVSVADARALIGRSKALPEPVQKLKFGVEARLDWDTHAISALDLGFMHFVPKPDCAFNVHASASMALGDRKATLRADARLAPFNIIALKCLDVEFREVRFEIREDGTREFTTEIGEVGFTGALSFINNLKELFKSLEDRFGIVLSVTPQQVTVSQKIMIPPADGAQPAGTLQLGPATIANLNFNWGVRIPLQGRRAMSVAFGLASREDPLTIFVPPDDGGKAHALMEVTTRGVRLFEVSLEFGALIFVRYSIAKGEVSFMGGIFFQVAKDPAAGIDTFMLSAYVKVTGQLDVASIIRFSGLIFVAMTYEKGSKSGTKISGEATVTVSMKIGFARVSYSFTARHEENRNDGTKLAVADATPSHGIVIAESQLAASSETCSPQVSEGFDEYPFRHTDPTEEAQFRQQWRDFVRAYAS